MKKNLIVLQEGSNDCGSAALLSIIRYYGGDINLDRLIEMTKTTKDGTNFYNISEASYQLGLDSRSYKVDDIEKIKDINVPFMAQLQSKNYNHFVVIYKVYNDKVVIMDPARGKCIFDIFEFSSMWTGYIMVFEKTRYIPSYSNKKVLNKIITMTLLKNKGTVVILSILSIIFTLLSCLTSLYSQKVFDKVIDTNINNLIIVTIAFSILFIIKNVTSYVRNYFIIYFNQKLDISVILSTFSKVILLPYIYYKNKTTSEVLSRINDLTYIKNFISKVIVTIFLNIFTFIISLIVIYNINKKIVFILLGISLIYLVIVLIFNSSVKNITRINQENNANLNNAIIEGISSYETVKGLNIEDNIIFNFSKIYSKSLNDAYYGEKMNNLIVIIKSLVTDIGLLGVSFMCMKLIMNNALTVGDYMAITFLMGYLIYPMRDAIDIMNEYHYTKNSIIRANNLLENEEEKICDERRLDVFGNIVVKNLSYTFNNRYYILDNLSLEFKKRERVLIMGPSGGGKSTLLKILYRYYPIDRDKVFINNYDINDYSLSDIRKKIVYISQNEILYSDSIRNNILLGRGIEEDKFLSMCKITCVDEIVRDSLLGYDYMLSENGSNISGGQRQRIILTRSLLKNSNIIMIDEALSQMDINLERKILKNIFYCFADKMIIVVSHRKENMDLYDRVIEIEDGKLKNNLVRCNSE